ncbi:hypothetical protein [Raineyella sp. LH-20]|uniref:4'-phosphopantetheinyl transferase family protein n=1 Tax=Raineyella sp. LH-20 TaxID=3081204 RepID=UPI002954C566|nr:hypothetical protein [Raineyella sp. LH-20]WOP18893.1 hypothetical protein R0146_01055 [Raineyella sp. LH-20]
MGIEVWWSSLTAADRSLRDLLDPVERARVDSLEHPADRGRSLVGAALLRVAVAAHLGAAPDDVLVDRTCTGCGGPHGAPRVILPAAGASGTRSRTLGLCTAAPGVSVSHSGLLVVVALRPAGPVGVDVQRVADLEDAPGSAAHRHAAGSTREAEAWVRREALFKAGVRASVRPARRAPSVAWAASAAYAARSLSTPLPGYAAALAVPGGPAAAPTVRHWPAAEGQRRPRSSSRAKVMPAFFSFGRAIA